MEKNNSRRDFIIKSAALALGVIATKSIVANAAATSEFLEKEIQPLEITKYSLAPLPYNYDALEPHIDKLTMEIHHSKHHKAYIDNLNKALETSDISILGGDTSLGNIFNRVAKLPASLRNNAGGHYNHSLFWTMMKPNGGGVPTGKLAEAINTSFISFDEFKKQFADVAMKRFGSGWAWLVNNKGKLSIGSTANQDNPLMNLDTVEVKGAPILALDVWEHAYYLKNQNRRAEYITSFWNVVNWGLAEELFISSSH